MSGLMNHTPANVIRTLLITHAMGTASSAAGAWPIHHAREPDSPDDVITVTGTTGVNHSRVHIDGEVNEHHGIQVRVRSSIDQDGYVKANTIDHELLTQVNLEGVTIGGSSYCVFNVSRTGTINYLGMDTPNSTRHLFTINYLVHLRMA